MKGQSYKIDIIQLQEYDQLIEFVMRIRKEVFPMINDHQVPEDLLHFEKNYLCPKTSLLVGAYIDGEIIGTFGVVPYDGRFKRLEEHCDLRQSTELVKCYLDPAFRRMGIGTELYKEALAFCRKVGYETIYLHTHPFLPGAVSFWKAQGFVEIMTDPDPIWQTVHMVKKIKQEEKER